MSTVPRPSNDTPTDVLEALSKGRCRRVIAALDERSPVSEDELARLIAASERVTDPADVGEQRAKTVRTELRHVQLPQLAEAGLVAWNRDAGTVAASRVLPDDDRRTVVEMHDDVWNGLFECLASRRRRAALDALREEGPMTEVALAREVARREDGTTPSDDVLISLDHVHLPMLAEAGLVEVDSDRETVSYEGASILPVADTLGLLAAEDR